MSFFWDDEQHNYPFWFLVSLCTLNSSVVVSCMGDVCLCQCVDIAVVFQAVGTRLVSHWSESVVSWLRAIDSGLEPEMVSYYPSHFQKVGFCFKLLRFTRTFLCEFYKVALWHTILLDTQQVVVELLCCEMTRSSFHWFAESAFGNSNWPSDFKKFDILDLYLSFCHSVVVKF